MERAPVSVIIPTFRDGGALRRALASVAGQTLLPAEIIIVDDAGTDPMLDDVAASTGLLCPQILRLARNVGPGGARNAGIAVSSEPFIAFLDADDEWHPEKLARQMTVMLASGAPTLSAHAQLFEAAPWPAILALASPVPIGRRALLFANPASISSVIIRRDAIRYLFPEWHAVEDYFFLAANILAGIDAVRLPETLARACKVPFGAGGLSGRLWAMQLGEMRTHLHLWREGLIDSVEYLPLVPWTLLKFTRRLAIVAARRLSLFRSA